MKIPSLNKIIENNDAKDIGNDETCPITTTKIVDLFPWRSMSDTLTDLDLSECGLTELPKGFCFLDDQKIAKINLKGNPLSDVVKAVITNGEPRDIILMAKEMIEGGAELKEKKVLVVGDAAVGKTTLLRELKAEREVTALGKTALLAMELAGERDSEVMDKLATDGIEIGELELDGVLLNCWDFAGQEVYRYTHQLFLSDSSIYLILFDLSQPFPFIYSQLTYWLYSITNRAPASQILLVGTHASVAPPEKTQQTAKEVAHKFRKYVGGEVLMVDSLTGEGLESLKKVLSGVARRNLPRVPRLFEQIRNSFQKYRDAYPNDHFVEANQLRQGLKLDHLTDKSWEWSLRVLNCLGVIVLVHRDSYMENQHTRSTFVVLRPSWLVDVFKTVVTMRHNFVKDGVISIKNLRRCWREYDVSMHDLLLEALENFDVVCRLEEGKVIVPCLLPDCPPHNFTSLVQNGDEESKTTFRRSFLLRNEKNRLPSGVMGRVLSAMFQWGKILYAWRAGCIVVCDDVTVVMWEDWCGNRAGVHFVFYTDKFPLSPSFFGSSIPTFASLHHSSTRSRITSSMIKSLLQKASQMMKNLFEDFYKVDYEAIIPCCVDEQGIPFEWVKVAEALVAMFQNEPKVMVVIREGGNGGTVAVGGLAPDLVLEKAPLSFSEDSIVWGRLLGEGSFGAVWEAEIPWEGNEEERLHPKREKEKDIERLRTRKVAVKKLLPEGPKLVNETTLTSLHHETDLSFRAQHPNIVEMIGFCSQASRPLLFMELLEGVSFCFLFFFFLGSILLTSSPKKDLYTSLMDPLGIESTLKKLNHLAGICIKEQEHIEDGKSRWGEIVSSQSGNCFEFYSLFKEFRGIFGKCPKLLQQKGQE